MIISLFGKSKNSFLNCLFKITSSCPSKNYFPQSFPDFYSISLHGFYSGEKWEVFQSFGHVFARAQKAILENKVFTIWYNLNQILTHSVFWWFLFLRNPKNSFLNCLFKYTSSCTSKNYFPQSFPDFYSISFHGFYSGEKWEVFQSFGDFFFKGPKSSLSK